MRPGMGCDMGIGLTRAWMVLADTIKARASVGCIGLW